jgi:hypothetical protein
MNRILLFLTACILPGLGGAVGSMAGNAMGRNGLWAGGIVGGVLASVLVAWIARRAGWISDAQFAGTALGTVVGFLAAAAIAVKTLSSPIGPVLSTLIAGFGALAGSGWRVRGGR